MTTETTELAVAMNSVSVTYEEMARAWRGDEGLEVSTELAAVLDARLEALRAWSEVTGAPVSPCAIEAAACAVLIRTPLGLRFGEAQFADFVEFLHHMPW
jgi:hypothetical protein